MIFIKSSIALLLFASPLVFGAAVLDPSQHDTRISAATSRQKSASLGSASVSASFHVSVKPQMIVEGLLEEPDATSKSLAAAAASSPSVSLNGIVQRLEKKGDPLNHAMKSVTDQFYVPVPSPVDDSVQIVDCKKFWRHHKHHHHHRVPHNCLHTDRPPHYTQIFDKVSSSGSLQNSGSSDSFLTATGRPDGQSTQEYLDSKSQASASSGSLLTASARPEGQRTQEYLDSNSQASASSGSFLTATGRPESQSTHENLASKSQASAVSSLM